MPHSQLSDISDIVDLSFEHFSPPVSLAGDYLDYLDTLSSARPSTSHFEIVCSHCGQHGIRKQRVTPGSSMLDLSNLLTLVQFNGPSDPEKPGNWSATRRWLIVVILAMLTLAVTFTSSVWSGATAATAREFEVSEVVMDLGITLYVLGFAAGPLIWGPLSEIYGRTRPLAVAYGLFVIFQIPLAVAQDVAGILIFRFLAGLMGSSSFAIAPGMLLDVLPPMDRGKGLLLFFTTVFFGPCVGTVVGAYITTGLNWRWVAWLSLIVGAVPGLLAMVVIQETFEPVILQRRALRLRQKNKHWALHSKLDEHPITWQSLRTRYLIKPLIMIIQEPVLIVMTIYTSLIYGIVYLIIIAIPLSFVITRGWKFETATLPFLAFGGGVVGGCVLVHLFEQLWWSPRFASRGKLLPEDRLPPIIVGSLLLPASLMWFGWTSDASMPVALQIVPVFWIGVGLYLIFLPAFEYMIDVYLSNANSALAANGCVRAVIGAVTPLFGYIMFTRLGVPWASSLLAFLLLSMVPFPVVFWYYGKRIRSWSKFSFDL